MFIYLYTWQIGKTAGLMTGEVWFLSVSYFDRTATEDEALSRQYARRDMTNVPGNGIFFFKCFEFEVVLLFQQ